jgi:hypothetical protein
LQRTTLVAITSTQLLHRFSWNTRNLNLAFHPPPRRNIRLSSSRPVYGPAPATRGNGRMIAKLLGRAFAMTRFANSSPSLASRQTRRDSATGQSLRLLRRNCGRLSSCSSLATRQSAGVPGPKHRRQ